MTEELFTIKGIREGLLLTLKPDGIEWNELVKKVGERIDEQKAFFKGARLALNVGARPVRNDELNQIKTLLSNREVILWAVISESDTTQSAARGLNMETSLVTATEDQLDAPPVSPEEVGTPGVVFIRTLRNGRTIRTEGSVTVIGDVNPGATIVAGGSILVWGRLRGIVHAGANGDERSVVCALDLIPTQLRIANHFSVSPEDKRRKPKPEMAVVRDGRIVAQAWND